MHVYFSILLFVLALSTMNSRHCLEWYNPFEQSLFSFVLLSISFGYWLGVLAWGIGFRLRICVSWRTQIHGAVTQKVYVFQSLSAGQVLHACAPTHVHLYPCMCMVHMSFSTAHILQKFIDECIISDDVMLWALVDSATLTMTSWCLFSQIYLLDFGSSRSYSKTFVHGYLKVRYTHCLCSLSHYC